MPQPIKELLAKVAEAKKSGDKAGALAAAQALVADHPQEVRGHVHVAQLLGAAGRHDEALEQAAHSLDRFPNQVALLGAVVTSHRAKGDVDAAIASAQALVGAHPGAPAFVRLVQLHTQKKDFVAALAQATAGLDQFADDPALLAAASNAARLSGDPAAALAYARQARQKDAGLAPPYVSEVLALAALGRHAGALQAAKKGLKLFPKNLALLAGAHDAATRQGDHRAALDYAGRRVAEAPHLEGARVDLVQSTIALNRLDEATALVAQALDDFPRSKNFANLKWLVEESIAIPDRASTVAARPAPKPSGTARYIFSIPFNIARFAHSPQLSDPKTGRLSKKWISYRLKLFMNYTCKSLMNQTNQDFHALFLADPLSIGLIEKEMGKYYKLPANIEVIDGGEHRKRLAELMAGADTYFHTKLDSDNMYQRDYVELLHRHRPDPATKFLAFTKGYALDANSGAIALYRATQEYFYTRVGRTSQWKEDFQLAQPIGGTPAAAEMPHEVIDEPDIFMITCHDINVSNNVAMVRPTKTLRNPAAIARVWRDFTGGDKVFTL